MNRAGRLSRFGQSWCPDTRRPKYIDIFPDNLKVNQGCL